MSVLFNVKFWTLRMSSLLITSASHHIRRRDRVPLSIMGPFSTATLFQYRVHVLLLGLLLNDWRYHSLQGVHHERLGALVFRFIRGHREDAFKVHVYWRGLLPVTEAITFFGHLEFVLMHRCDIHVHLFHFGVIIFELNFNGFPLV